MSYHRSYPFAPETALFFSQELVKNVLKDFGVYWKVKRSEREKKLRAVATYVYTPEVGKLVTHFSRMFGIVVVKKCLDTWKYITFHRESVWEELLFNSIVNSCDRSYLATSDKAIIFFMAIMVEQARLVKLEEKDYLVETIVKALCYCMTNLIPGGFVNTLDRLKHCASEYIYPETSGEYDGLLVTIQTPTQSTESRYTSMVNEFYAPVKFYDPRWKVTVQEIKEHLEKREAIRQFAGKKHSQTKKTLSIKNIVDSRTDISKRNADVRCPKKHLATQTPTSSGSCDAATQTPTSSGSCDAATQTPTSSASCDAANQTAILKDYIDYLPSSNDNDCVKSQVENIDLNAGSKSLSTIIELPANVSEVNAGDQLQNSEIHSKRNEDNYFWL